MAKHVALLIDPSLADRPELATSRAACAEALQSTGYRVSDVAVGRDIARVLSDLAPDVVFTGLSGLSGLGGRLQGTLELLDLPYTHSGVLASALAMDKHQAKTLFKAAGIPVTDHVIVDRGEAGRAHVMALPYVIKPVAGVGHADVFVVRGQSVHPPSDILGADWVSGEEVMVERFIPGRDLSCAVMGDVALGVSEIVIDPPPDYHTARHGKAGSVHILPADVKPKIYDKVQKMALAAHAALGCRGVTLTDFRFNDAAGEDGELVCLEINTQPEMTPRSLVPEQAAHAGHSFQELVSWLVEDASCNR